MKTNRYLILIGFLGVMIACSKPSLKKYSPHTTFPRAIFVENQIQKIQTEKLTSTKNPLYIDLRMKDGQKESGKLIQISEEYVKLSRGYYYMRDKGNKILKFDHVVMFPKNEILFMKIW